MSETIDIEHWVYGVTPGKGFGIKAVSKDLNVGLYNGKLDGHYTPIRSKNVQDDNVDIRMIFPMSDQVEVLLSRVNRGPNDELGRMTFQNHTAIIPTKYLKGGALTLTAVDEAMRRHDEENPNKLEALDNLQMVLVPEGQRNTDLGKGLRKYITLAAAETVATRMMKDPMSRTYLVTRESTFDDRRRALYLLTDLLGFACGIPVRSSISDTPTGSQMGQFSFVVAARGVRADPEWVLVEGSMEKMPIGRLEGRDDVYARIAKAFER